MGSTLLPFLNWFFFSRAALLFIFCEHYCYHLKSSIFGLVPTEWRTWINSDAHHNLLTDSVKYHLVMTLNYNFTGKWKEITDKQLKQHINLRKITHTQNVFKNKINRHVIRADYTFNVESWYLASLCGTFRICKGEAKVSHSFLFYKLLYQNRVYLYILITL